MTKNPSLDSSAPRKKGVFRRARTRGTLYDQFFCKAQLAQPKLPKKYKLVSLSVTSLHYAVPWHVLVSLD